MTTRAEYRFTDYGTGHADPEGTDPTSPGDIDLQTHAVRIGIAYKF